MVPVHVVFRTPLPIIPKVLCQLINPPVAELHGVTQGNEDFSSHGLQLTKYSLATAVMRGLRLPQPTTGIFHCPRIQLTVGNVCLAVTSVDTLVSLSAAATCMEFKVLVQN